MAPRLLLLSIVLVVSFAPLTSHAVPIDVVVTGGQIRVSANAPGGFSDVTIALTGANFSLTNNGPTDAFTFTGPSAENPGLLLLPPGAPVDFSAQATLFGRPSEVLLFGGVSYLASGTLTLLGPATFVGSSVSGPFSLTGALHGIPAIGPEIDLALTGGGTMTALFATVASDGKMELRNATYQAVPEPGLTRLLVVAAVLLAGEAFATRLTTRLGIR